MLNLIKKDLILSIRNVVSWLLIVTLIPLLLILLDLMNSPGIVARVIYLVTHILILGSFDYETKNKPHTFINSLPIKRKEIVVSKYLLLFINFIVATVIIYAYLSLGNLFGARTMEGFNISAILSAFFMSMISIAIILPIYFMAHIRVASGIASGIFIFTFNLMEEIVGSKIFGKSYMVLIIIIAFLVSMYLSMVLYENKDLS